MSDILNELAELEPYRPGSGQCYTCRAIDDNPELGEAILNAYRTGVSIVQISRVLRNHGYDINERPLQNHLKNGHQPS